MPAQIDEENGTGIGTQTPTLKNGVMSRSTQLFDGASYTVPIHTRLHY